MLIQLRLLQIDLGQYGKIPYRASRSKKNLGAGAPRFTLGEAWGWGDGDAWSSIDDHHPSELSRG
jgi:hypothetical protein